MPSILVTRNFDDFPVSSTRRARREPIAGLANDVKRLVRFILPALFHPRYPPSSKMLRIHLAMKVIRQKYVRDRQKFYAGRHLRASSKSPKS
jgi:hypothetical protein